nr:UDP-N-acetylmuramoyl-L-alanyl-D-glutamate--2,6-diaminopimelate ligase [Syntrophomonas palmitatica]
MKLLELMKGIEYSLKSGDIEIDITGITYDSRKVKAGFLFVCISGFRTDGHMFIDQAIQNGAAAVLAEKEVDVRAEAALCLTSSTRQALAIAAGNFYQHPSRALRVIGVTGTNGKTTTTHLIKAILDEAGYKTSIIGTLYGMIGSQAAEMGHTTPEAPELEEFMLSSLQAGVQYAIMEVSSHALDLYRVDGIDFNSAVFTNLTQDHLDYHQTMHNYLLSKLKLFNRLAVKDSNFTVVNGDDGAAQEFIKASANHCYTYGINKNADVRAENVKTGMKGSTFKVKWTKGEFIINMKLIGIFSIYNALAAICFALGEGIQTDIIKSALEKVEGVAGRFETVNCGQKFSVIVDYAHTPDGLENILSTARSITPNRLICLFGCGGDRDRTKRPLMGEVAARYADFCVVTSDNPRSEDPQAIINDIIPGLEKVPDSRYAIIIDRREAIHHALNLAREGDMVIIAGKGHETYQLVKGIKYDFDDRKIAAEILKGMKKK